jgi:DNA-binding ferritin-like protein
MIKTKKETMSEYVKNWGKDQWESEEWRQYLISTLADYESLMDRLAEAERICDKQKDEITSLEKQRKLLQRQLELLQKTLDVAERFSRPLIISDSRKIGR